MKRILALTSAVLLTLSLAACSNTQNKLPSSNADNGASSKPQTTPNDNNETNTTVKTKTGLGMVISLEGSQGATENAPAAVHSEITVCAANFDDKGKILDVVFDVAEPGVEFDEAGALATDIGKPVMTKRQMGDNYGMKAYGGAKYEWYEQAAAVAGFAVNKTAAQLREGAVNEAGKAKDADLASVATIYIGSYVSAIEKAVQNAHHLGSAAGDTLRLSVINGMTATAAGEKDGAVELTVDVAAVTTKDQVISGCYIDALQAKVTFNAQGELTTDVAAAPQTKNELGEKYGMKAYAGAKFEWNEQAANFAAYVTNKTLAEVAGIAITEATKPADGTDLAATVTIAIGGFQALFAKLS